uniref:Uncharacterized protein n=1 Tax=Musa acuminata subsp. malaccensis TaxID=214687 RepID=A0A804JNE2_MUSAM
MDTPQLLSLPPSPSSEYERGEAGGDTRPTESVSLSLSLSASRVDLQLRNNGAHLHEVVQPPLR